MTYREQEILRLKACLTKIRKAIDEVIENGISYSLNGSHSVTMADMQTLREMESATRGRILSLQGTKICRRSMATFDGGGL